MSRVCLVVLIGIPGAGKTTFANYLKTSFQSDTSVSVIHISFDELFPLETAKIESGSFKTAREEYVAFIEACTSNIKTNTQFPEKLKHFTTKCNVHEHNNYDSSLDKVYLVIDDNNYYRSMRYKLYQIARSFEVSFVQIFLDCDEEEAIRRDKEREQPVGERIIQNMIEKLEKPSKFNAWEKDTLFLGLDHTDFTVISKFLLDAIQSPLKNLHPIDEDETPKISQSDLHLLDLSLRKSITSIISSDNSTNKPAIALDLNEKRKQILEDVKNGRLDINLVSSGSDQIQLLMETA